MNIIFGFGKSEEQQRESVKEEIEKIIKNVWEKTKGKNFLYPTCITIDDNFEKEFKKQFKKLAKNIKVAYDKAEKATPKPGRYFHIDFGQAIAFSIDTIFVKIKFWHINSRHPFSPDGIALLQHSETFTFELEDLINNNTNV